MRPEVGYVMDAIISPESKNWTLLTRTTLFKNMFPTPISLSDSQEGPFSEKSRYVYRKRPALETSLICTVPPQGGLSSLDGRVHRCWIEGPWQPGSAGHFSWMGITDAGVTDGRCRGRLQGCGSPSTWGAGRPGGTSHSAGTGSGRA